MKYTFEIVTGPMRSGKTTYSKRSGAKFISCDNIMGNERSSGAVGFNKVVDIVNSSNENCIIDGWFGIYNQNPQDIFDLQKLLKNHKIVFTVIYAPMEWLLSHRDQLSGVSLNYQTKEEINKVYKHIIDLYSKYLLDFQFNFKVKRNDWCEASNQPSVNDISFYEFSKLVHNDFVTINKNDIDIFKQKLNDRPGDKRYQTIELPFGMTIQARDEETSPVMQQISKQVSFRGKTVLDLGCYHCGCTFDAENFGAKYVVGVDRMQSFIDTANDLKNIWHYNTELITADVSNWTPMCSFDIIMCLNAIQYTDVEKVIKTMFNYGNIVIFESYEKFKEIYIKNTTHKLFYEEETLRWRSPSIVRYIYYFNRI